jgi:hypothetical protein
LLLTQADSLAQKNKKPFTGSLTYRITVCDTSLSKVIPERYMNVYTNDTLTRIENETDRLGKQVVIKHLYLNKSYLLLNTPMGKYAIQTNHNTSKKDSITSFTFKKRCGRNSFCNIKANKALVTHKGFPKPLIFYYIKTYDPKYLNAFENFPGLPVLYYIPTDEALIKYELISIKHDVPEYDLFGIPSDFKRTSFDEFIEELIQQQKEPNINRE